MFLTLSNNKVNNSNFLIALLAIKTNEILKIKKKVKQFSKTNSKK